jgi:hypothetical protein
VLLPPRLPPKPLLPRRLPLLIRSNIKSKKSNNDE